MREVRRWGGQAGGTHAGSVVVVEDDVDDGGSILFSASSIGMNTVPTGSYWAPHDPRGECNQRG